MKAVTLWLIVVLLMPKGNPPETVTGYYAYADTDSVFVQGDSLVGQQNQDEFLQFINGDVRVNYGSTEITSDQAVRNVTRSQTSFTGNSVLIDQGDTLEADALDYNEDLEIGRAVGNVRLTDGEVVTTSPKGVYYVEERRVEFPEGLVLIDSLTTLVGDSGFYWTDTKIADMSGDVMMESEDARLFADSLLHYREHSISLAQGSVRYLRTTLNDSLWIAGERFEYNANDSLAIVEGDPIFINIEYDSLSVDTLIIRADVMHLQDRMNTSRLDATRNVRIWNSSLSATADSVAYQRLGHGSNEEIWLYGLPFVWMNQTQLSGDTMKVIIHDGNVDSLMIWGNAFVAEEDSLIQRINQVKGHTLVSRTMHDSVRVIIIGPNAEAIYFNADEEGLPDGAIEASSDEIRMMFEGDSLRTLSFSTDVKGIRHPQKSVTDDLKLEGLQWNVMQKPSKYQLLGDFVHWMQRWEN